MGQIILTTESGTDLLPEHARKLGIHVIPMHVVFGGESREDGSFPVTEVFDYYKRTRSLPTTSAVNPQEYIEFFTELRRTHRDAEIIHIAYTALASSTCQNAAIALEELGDERIFLVDSRNVSGGISLICEKAAELAAKAQDAAEVVKELESWILRARVSFLPNTLEYLKAGGRVSNAAYLGASLLKLKPLINIEEGRLVAAKKYRGVMGHVAFLYFEEFVEKNHLDRELLYLFYTEGFSMERMDELKKRAAELGFQKVLLTRCGCVISCHGGAGALGVAGFAAE
ncbi:MAG: DegV family protein [Lachnospiraceae bacterium]|nr:DegV family protein [Lachnospiraceae bacterium]